MYFKAAIFLKHSDSNFNACRNSSVLYTVCSGNYDFDHLTRIWMSKIKIDNMLK